MFIYFFKIFFKVEWVYLKNNVGLTFLYVKYVRVAKGKVFSESAMNTIYILTFSSGSTCYITANPYNLLLQRTHWVDVFLLISL